MPGDPAMVILFQTRSVIHIKIKANTSAGTPMCVSGEAAVCQSQLWGQINYCKRIYSAKLNSEV